MQRLFLSILTILLCANSAICRSQIASPELKYEDLLDAGKRAAVIREIGRTCAHENSDKSIEGLGLTLGRYADYATAVLDGLAEEPNIANDTIRAELLLWVARGDEAPKGEKKEREVQPATMPTDDIGRRAAELLDHDDPFVRGLAEWAIAIRVGMENAGPRAVWPQKESPEWYLKWMKKLDGDFILECDYVRQAAVLGVHRSTKKLLESGREIVARIESLNAGIFRRTADKQSHVPSDVAGAYQRLVVHARTKPEDVTGQRRLWLELRRAARKTILANPDVDFRQVVFATRHAYHDGPNITAGAKPYIIKPGGDVFVKSGLSPHDPVRPLIDHKLPPGHMRGMELWWGADRVVFAYASQPRYYEETLVESDQGFDDKIHGASEPTHVYEIGTDGMGLRQITNHPFNSDVEPAYLPNGDIVFCSDRANYGSQCSGSFLQNKKIVNLYRIRPDGTGLRALHSNKDFDRYPHVMDNGLVLYTRWEYQERHLWQTHNLWTMRPDGTMTNAIYKEHINSGPMALRDPRQIPGSHKLVAIACGHHEYAQGAVTIVDHHAGINDSAGMRIVTPHISPREGGIGRGRKVEEGGVQDGGGLYQQPYALSEHSFLVSYSYHLPRNQPNAINFGIYYIDVWGNKELIHREPILSSVYPIPLKKRPVPPTIPDTIESNQVEAACYVSDVYRGLDGTERGTVKYIRISHRTEQPTFHTGDKVTDYNHLHYVPDGSWSHVLGVWTWTPARVIGIVPVEEDGSAYFKVPVNIPLYFQALDKNYMEIRRMRSFVSFQPGEVRGCTGCHETRDQAPAKHFRAPLALGKPAAVPVPPVWGDTILPDYERHIQPILSKHCVSCHGQSSPAAGLEFTARKVDFQCQSYRTMFGLSALDRTPVWAGYNYKLLYPDADPLLDKESLKKMAANEYPGQLISLSDRFSDASITKPMQFGSHKSRLITALLDGIHKEQVEFSKAEWIALVTWVDLNAPYWGSFVDKEPLRQHQRPRRVFVQFPAPFEAPTGPCKIVETYPITDTATTSRAAAEGGKTKG